MKREYEGEDRRRSITLDEKDVDAFIDRAIERATDKFYAEVGKSVVTKVLWMIGIAVVAGYFAAKHKGLL